MLWNDLGVMRWSRVINDRVEWNVGPVVFVMAVEANRVGVFRLRRELG